MGESQWCRLAALDRDHVAANAHPCDHLTLDIVFAAVHVVVAVAITAELSITTVTLLGTSPTSPTQPAACSSAPRRPAWDAVPTPIGRAILEHHLPPLIIHVRNTGDQGEPDEPNTPGWHLAFQPKPGEYVIDKLKNNAFAGTSLGEIVRPDAEMVVVGMQSDFCVRATCSAALGRGNEVLLIKGAHATYDRIEVWYGGRITPASRVEVEVENELEEAGVIVLDMKDVSGIFNGR
ncbi:hypothetical protein ONZ45_g4464 [Pleurotus djamor]|nr:hypothetical protein ONZ45_g4464 [Pleurotus djamor]